MIRVEAKPIKDVIQAVANDRRILILRCGGCPEGANTGGPAAAAAVSSALWGAGHEVFGPVAINFLCHKALILSRLAAPELAWQVERADRVVVFSCGVGVQAVASALMKPVAPAMNTQDLGGLQGKFPGVERCRACGDCLLDRTGGICPIATCSKSLVNGTCGGTNKGKCEVSPEKPCGWLLIYNRLKELGRLADYKKYNKPRDHSRLDIPDALRRTIWWGLEVPEEASK